MLTKPEHGWTDFQLEGTGIYGLSYLDDIAVEWLDQAIHGLETMLPFCVKGFLEPRRLLCTVSYWNCHIVVETDGRNPPGAEDLRTEWSHISMLEFFKQLHHDVAAHAEEWAVFLDYDQEDPAEKRRRLREKLERLEALIAQKEECFDEHHCFL